jgi:Spy/CpxP family protein refolding chaperone
MLHNRALAPSLSLSLSLLLLALPLACNKDNSQPAPAASSASAPAPEASTAPPPSASAHNQRSRGREQGGPAGTMFRAAHDLPLTDAQKATVDTLETQLQAGDAPTDDFKALQTDIVAGIHAGKLDNTKLQTDFAAIDAAIAAHAAKEGDALNGLYVALDPGERTSLVAAVRAKQGVRDAQFAAHADVDAGAFDWTKRRLQQMTMQLGLDAGQQKSVGAILGKDDSMSPATMKTQRDEGKKRMEAVLTAFEGTAFDPKKVDLSGIPGKTRHEGLEKDTTFLSQLLPLLTPEQRDKLATQRERSGGRHRPEGNGGGHEPGGNGGAE